ncbi:hypothetical protein NDU88_003299 [Pleurodeles waltl]|uniref:Uncharacterized protein n=1 Tax=Pleurodeles waltl TaxID=8319 RepID=A0AAV7LI58_PLEWA|nr:hypothetical protein NDU88_003299 [Pleurodeles waltl]
MFGGLEGVVRVGVDLEGGFVGDGYSSSDSVCAIPAGDLVPSGMAMAMSGAEESFHQVSVRKATSGVEVLSKSQSSMACLRAERVLRSMQWRWLVLVFGGLVVLLQVNLQLWQEKGPWVFLGEDWKHAAERAGLRVLRSLAV